jgi:hypothetical protein
MLLKLKHFKNMKVFYALHENNKIEMVGVVPNLSVEFIVDETILGDLQRDLKMYWQDAVQVEQIDTK